MQYSVGAPGNKICEVCWVRGYECSVPMNKLELDWRCNCPEDENQDSAEVFHPCLWKSDYLVHG